MVMRDGVQNRAAGRKSCDERVLGCLKIKKVRVAGALRVEGVMVWDERKKYLGPRHAEPYCLFNCTVRAKNKTNSSHWRISLRHVIYHQICREESWLMGFRSMKEEGGESCYSRKMWGYLSQDGSGKGNRSEGSHVFRCGTQDLIMEVEKRESCQRCFPCPGWFGLVDWNQLLD